MKTFNHIPTSLFTKKSFYFVLIVALATAVFAFQVQADSIAIDFESFNLGSVDG